MLFVISFGGIVVVDLSAVFRQYITYLAEIRAVRAAANYQIILAGFWVFVKDTFPTKDRRHYFCGVSYLI